MNYDRRILRLAATTAASRALERATARCQKEFSRITVADLAKASGCRPEEQRTTLVNSTLYRRRRTSGHAVR